ncbi:hypothetical protein BT96DRAFT_921302 [Gymnopus androsaceus JB14]|uniref:DUF6533 domain-containing protein n=1 Tax=Gymnopus androsaceus JB14 TaxID=1447944 RepID=A0A6A4HJA4_9AGAR|nr:hypothetical protein BT96DRAFT_921302 [Gymnopus androsaceus JB14]
MQTRIIASVLGLLVTSCDSFLTRHKELEYVWKRPLQLTFVRCLFILARYLALLIHIGNIVLASIWTFRFSGHQQPTDDACMTWFIFQTASYYTMVLILQLILSFPLITSLLQYLTLYRQRRMAGSIYVDGLKVFAAISFGVISIGVSAGKRVIPVVLVYPLFISLVSAAGCRTILNLQTLNVTTRETPSFERNIEFTSINDISTWDARSRLVG